MTSGRVRPASLAAVSTGSVDVVAQTTMSAVASASLSASNGTAVAP